MFLLSLYIVGVGSLPWFSIPSVLLGFVLAWKFSPIQGFLVPIRLTSYPVVNILLFFVPFIPIVMVAGQPDERDALAMLLFMSVLLPVPWTFFAVLEILVHRQPGMLETTDPKEHAYRHLHSRRFLLITWGIAGVALVLSSLLVLINWAIVG